MELDHKQDDELAAAEAGLPAAKAADFLQEVERHGRNHKALATNMREALLVVGELRTQVARLEARLTALERGMNARAQGLN